MSVEVNHARAICWTCRFSGARVHSLAYWEDREELEAWMVEHAHDDEGVAA